MKKRILLFFVLPAMICAAIISEQPKKKMLYKKFTEFFDKKAEQVRTGF